MKLQHPLLLPHDFLADDSFFLASFPSCIPTSCQLGCIAALCAIHAIRYEKKSFLTSHSLNQSVPTTHILSVSAEGHVLTRQTLKRSDLPDPPTSIPGAHGNALTNIHPSIHSLIDSFALFKRISLSTTASRPVTREITTLISVSLVDTRSGPSAYVRTLFATLNHPSVPWCGDRLQPQTSQRLGATTHSF